MTMQIMMIRMFSTVKYQYAAETGIDAMDYDDEDEYLEEQKKSTDYL